MTRSQSALRFSGSNPNYRESTCGRWRIVKVGINGSARYEAWERNGQGVWRQVRVNLPTYAEASEHVEGLRAVPELDLEVNAAPGAIA